MFVDHTSPSSPPPPPPSPMTAGRYLQLRRESAGMTIEQVVIRLRAGNREERPIAEGWQRGTGEIALKRIEADELTLNDADLVLLLKAFPFDPFIYQCLRDEVPAGRICLGCGCSWNDACIVRGQPCSWTSSVEDMCTRCARPRAAVEHKVIQLDRSELGAFLFAVTDRHPIDLHSPVGLELEGGARVIGIICSSRATAAGTHEIVTLVSDRKKGSAAQ